MKRRCDRCTFWVSKGYTNVKNHIDEHVGQCKRYPPQLDAVHAGVSVDEGGAGCEGDIFSWYQPLTESANWCGEFIRATKY